MSITSNESDIKIDVFMPFKTQDCRKNKRSEVSRQVFVECLCGANIIHIVLHRYNITLMRSFVPY